MIGGHADVPHIVTNKYQTMLKKSENEKKNGIWEHLLNPIRVNKALNRCPNIVLNGKFVNQIDSIMLCADLRG